jgi:integrase/recombinase XerD
LTLYYLIGSGGKPNSIRNSLSYIPFFQFLAFLTCSEVKFLASVRLAPLRLAKRRSATQKLTQPEIQLIFSNGLDNDHDRTLFVVCLFSACRIRKCCTLQTQNVYTPKGIVRPRLIIRKSNSKGKLATRSIPVIKDLRQLLNNYYPIRGETYLFPSRSDGHISEDSAARILKMAFEKVGIIGVSTHSFRRTALTQMSNAGIPLRGIQDKTTLSLNRYRVRIKTILHR